MIFMSDLDRTLIFSYKRLSADNICVEEKDGKKLSYMTPRSAELFGEAVKRVTFIPVTTRSVEQYRRITFPGKYVPEYALTDNGARLLINGEECEEWFETWYRDLVNGCLDEMAHCREFLEKDPSVYFEVRTVDGVFLFTKSRAPEETVNRMREFLPPRDTEYFTNGEKLYVMPKKVSKGSALIKLREKTGERITAAGDSLFDIDMLTAADTALIKSGELTGMELNPCQITEPEGDDPDFVISTLIKILDNR